MNKNLLNESVIRKDMLKSLNETTDIDIDLFYDGMRELAGDRIIKATRQMTPMDGLELECERGGKWYFNGISNNNIYNRFYMSLYHDWCNDPAPMTACGHNFCFSVYDGKVIDLGIPMCDEDQPKLQELFVEKACEALGKSVDEILALGKLRRSKKDQNRNRR